MSYEEKCSEVRSKSRKLGCYASHAASRLKREAIRATRWHGRQEQEHPRGYLVLGLLVVGIVFLGGGALLSYTFTVNNPTVAQTTYTTTWKFSNGTVIPNNAQISGIITCTVQPSQSAVTEGSLVGNPDAIVPTPNIATLVPYWITRIKVNVFSGSSASGSPIRSETGAVQNSSYLNSMQAWGNAWATTILNNPYDQTKWVVGDTPTSNPPNWVLTVDTRNLPNGVYTLQAAVSWGTSSLVSGIVKGPPSLGSTTNDGTGLMLLSAFVVGIGETPPSPPQDTSFTAFIALGVIAVAIILLAKRR